MKRINLVGFLLYHRCTKYMNALDTVISYVVTLALALTLL